MDMEHIKPSAMLTFRAILYSPQQLLMSFIDRLILIATYMW
jgi:hypothetical protein